MTKFIGFLFLFQILFYSCNKNESIRPLVSPSFSTNVPTEVTPTSVTLSATIKTIGSKSIADHGLYCDDHGFYWSENKGVNAKTGTIISLGPALVTGSFEAKIFNLKRGTLYYAVAFVNIGGTTFLGNEISFSTTSHTITSVSPSSATVGTSVVISGTNFVTDPSKITLSVGGVPVSVSSSTETEITFLVPTNFSAGKKNLSIKIDALEKLLVDGFTVIPSITSISPLRSLSLQTITIQGNGFSSISSEIAVSFDAVSASVLSSSVNEIKVIVPESAPTGPCKINLTVNSIGAATNPDFFIQGWLKLLDIPFAPRFAACSFLIDNKLYVGLGKNLADQTFNDFWEINLNDGTSKQLNNFPGGGRFDLLSFTIGSKGYITLGRDSQVQPQRETWEYDPVGDSWTRKTDFPGIYRDEAVQFVFNDIAFLGNGIANGINELTDFYQFNPETNQWTTAPSFGGAGIYGQASVVINNTPFLMGGARGPDIVSEVWAFNGTSWSQKTNLIGTKVTNGSAFNSGVISCFGFGWVDNNTASVSNYIYNVQNDAWQKTKDFSGPGRFKGISGYNSQVWYFGLGFKGGNEYKDLWVFKF